jgi:hypothetical protein
MDSSSKPSPFSNENCTRDSAKQIMLKMYKGKHLERSPETVGLLDYSFCSLTPY